MAITDFHLQGIDEDAYTREKVEEILSLPNAEGVIISTAFVRQLGVEDIADALRNCHAQVDVYVGINNGHTSYEGLISLHRLDINLVTVDTGSSGEIFHPKIYCSFSRDRALLLVGSANLTFSGLNNNIEAGLFLDLDLGIAEDKAILDKVNNSFSRMIGTHPENVIQIQSELDIDHLFLERALASEASSGNSRRAQEGESTSGAPRNRMNLPTRRPRTTREVIAPPVSDVEVRSNGARLPEAPTTEASPIHVWTKKNLSNTDAQIPSQPGSNPKGCISLTQARFTGADSYLINQTSYFRQDVFGDLEWVNNSQKKREEAFATFELLIDGRSRGRRTLMISHKSSREASQGNYTTALHVGHFTADFPDTKGKDLKLFKISKDSYRIEVD